MKILVAVAFVAILGALFTAGVSMVRSGRQVGEGQPKSKAMARALAWRVGISVSLFIALLLAYLLGWIEPTGMALR